jgi:hypothetical protein
MLLGSMLANIMADQQRAVFPKTMARRIDVGNFS